MWTSLRLPHPHDVVSTIKARLHVRWTEADSLPTLPRFFPILAMAPFRNRAIHTGAFALVLVLILLPLKILGVPQSFEAARGRVLGATATAAQAFGVGGAALERSSFDEALSSFAEAREAIAAIPTEGGLFVRLGLAIGRYLPGLNATATRAAALRDAGTQLSAASELAARGFALIGRADLSDPAAAETFTAATAAFASAQTFAERAVPHIRSALPTLAKPLEHGIGELRRAEALLVILRALGGIDTPKRILLVFQNPAELRPTGGFIGSFALLDVNHGTISALELPGGGSYDVSGVSRTSVIPPDPLRLLEPTWHFHDANWFPDFPTSAKKLRWFYEASGGPTVDAVVAINAPLIEDVLALTGPVRSGNRVFSSSDVLTVLTDTVEDPAARATGAPKAIIAELAPILLGRLLALGEDPTARLKLVNRALRALEERDVLFSFTDDATQRHVAAMHWDGAIGPASRDALMVVHANIGGGKSDAQIRNNIAHHAAIRSDGSVVVSLTITRTHEGVAGDSRNPSIRLANQTNVDYVRAYVPRGSKLINADGFKAPPATAFELPPDNAIPDRDLLASELDPQEDPVTGIRITEEFGRTAFGGWIRTEPGQTSTVHLTYELPWRYANFKKTITGSKPADPQSYSLAIGKQPGARTTISHTLELDPAWKITWAAPNLRQTDTQRWTFEDILTTDQLTGAMIAPR
ncbi:MAG: DUF4012 domain-containing protein [Candidatus Uhrbacteria bacterium]